MLFAPDGSKVHELEHDAGGVNTVVIAKAVIVFMVEGSVVAVAVTAVAASLILASTLSEVKIHQKELNGLARGKGGSLCTESLSSPSPTARLLVLILSFLTFTMLCF
jgi:hypothetical protein